ncbi:nucleolar protein dao-5-like [Clytia hemisphaerica]|uniref:Uncharacterized protein n=1 Tax=Clytia hemisphaerica TaxID=252671 RepID=A0A7M5V304_9CNID
MFMLENYVVLSPRGNGKPFFSLISSRPVQQISQSERLQVNKLICHVQDALLEFQDATMKLNFLKTKHHMVTSDRDQVLQLMYGISQQFTSIKLNIRTMLSSLVRNGYSVCDGIQFQNVTDMDNLMLQKYLTNGPQRITLNPNTLQLQEGRDQQMQIDQQLPSPPTVMSNHQPRYNHAAPSSPPNVQNQTSFHQERANSHHPLPNSYGEQSQVSPTQQTFTNQSNVQHKTSSNPLENNQQASHSNYPNGVPQQIQQQPTSSLEHQLNFHQYKPNQNDGISHINNESRKAENELENQPKGKDECRTACDSQPPRNNHQEQDSRPASTESSTSTFSTEDLDEFDRLVEDYVAKNIDKLLRYDDPDYIQIKKEKLENENNEHSCCSYEQQQTANSHSPTSILPELRNTQHPEDPTTTKIPPQIPSSPSTAVPERESTSPPESSNNQQLPYQNQIPSIPSKLAAKSQSPRVIPNYQGKFSTSTVFEFPPRMPALPQYSPKPTKSSPKTIDSPSSLKRLSKPESSTIKYIAKESPKPTSKPENKPSKTQLNEDEPNEQKTNKTSPNASVKQEIVSKVRSTFLSHLVKSKVPQSTKAIKSEIAPKPDSSTSSEPDSERNDAIKTTPSKNDTQEQLNRSIHPTSKHEKRKPKVEKNHSSPVSKPPSSDEDVTITKVRYMARRTPSNCVTKELRSFQAIKKEVKDDVILEKNDVIDDKTNGKSASNIVDGQKSINVEKKEKAPKLSSSKEETSVSSETTAGKEAKSPKRINSSKSENSMKNKRKSTDDNVDKDSSEKKKKVATTSEEIYKKPRDEIKHSEKPVGDKPGERSVDYQKEKLNKRKDIKTSPQRRMTDGEKMNFYNVVLQRKKAKQKQKEKEAKRKLSIDTKHKLKEIPLLASPEYQKSSMGSLIQPCSVKVQRLSKDKLVPEMEFFKLGQRGDEKTNTKTTAKNMKPNNTITKLGNKAFNESSRLNDKPKPRDSKPSFSNRIETSSSKRTQNLLPAGRPSTTKKTRVDQSSTETNNNIATTNNNNNQENKTIKRYMAKRSSPPTKSAPRPLETSSKTFDKNFLSVFNTVFEKNE